MIVLARKPCSVSKGEQFIAELKAVLCAKAIHPSSPEVMRDDPSEIVPLLKWRGLPPNEVEGESNSLAASFTVKLMLAFSFICVF